MAAMAGTMLLPYAAALAQAPAPAETSSAPAEAPSAPRLLPLGPNATAWRMDPAAGLPERKARRFVAKRSVTMEGRKVHYTVIAEDQMLRNMDGEPTGSIFSFSYIKDAAAGEPPRPVMFIFNGGPGSSSVWLHMGILGPRRVDFRDVTPAQVPPFPIVDNPDSVLAATDLVFIDPVGTGFSRYWGKGRAKDFYGREEDAAATVQFINSWLRKHKRWNSPKFVLGESYGTTRAALISRRLMGGVWDGTLRGVSLNGVILLGGDGGLADPAGNDRFLITFTTMAATAWYHGKVDRANRSFDQFTAEADRFAREELVPALDRWDSLDASAKAAIAKRHDSFTALGEAFLLSKNLRVTPADSMSRLLADKGELLGHYDSRYALPVANSLNDPVADDGAMGQYSAPFIGGFNSYARDELGIDIDEDYVVIDWVNVNFPFDHGKPTTNAATAFNVGAGDPGAELAAAMRRNPDLRLMSIQGWFDMFGPVGTAQYGIAQRHLPVDRVTAKAYFSGHMPYVGEAGPLMATDLKAFIRAASVPAPR